MSEVTNVVIELGSEMNNKLQEWKRNRMVWMNDSVVGSIERRSANKLLYNCKHPVYLMSRSRVITANH